MREIVLSASRTLHGRVAAALVAHLRRQRGILRVTADAAHGTLTIGYDEGSILEVEIQRVIEECGFHCRGQSLPGHECDYTPPNVSPSA
jgi:Cu2+-exporting ATPase